MSKKLTIVEQFARITAIMKGEIEPTQADFDFIAGRSELHAKKNASRKPTATQKINEGLATAIAEFMSEHKDEKFTITALMKSVPALIDFPDLTNQKTSAIVNGMVTNGIVEKTIEKGKSLFSIVQ